MAGARFEAVVESEFAAAHQLRGYRGRCENLHGHNWRVELSVTADRLDRLGMVGDFKEIRGLLERSLEELDHSCLNERPPFDQENPTCEAIARLIYGRVRELARDTPYQVGYVRVWESAGCSVVYREDA